LTRIRQIYRRLLLLLWIWKEPPPPPPPKQVRRGAARDADLYSFKAHILDYLDNQFESLEKMKKQDRGAYNLYKRVGAYIMADSWVFDNGWDYEEYRHMRGWWKTHRPSFAAFYMGHSIEPEDGRIYPSFLYFSKYDGKRPPPGIQRAYGVGDIYIVAFFYDHPTQGGRVAKYAVHVTPEGEIRCLKNLLDDPLIIRAKRRSGNGSRGHTFRVPSRKWGFDPLFEEMAVEHKISMENMLVGNFVMAVNGFSRQHEEMTKIRVTKGGLAAVFSIPVLRTPYFFKDREYYKTPSGNRKPIFHIVRTHKRDLQTGGQTYVKTHFRGHRHFVWNGYKINITVPGWHHPDLVGLDAKAHDLAEEDDQTGYLDEKQIGDLYTRIENPNDG
jgi:hypothetical protein|tara:strand:+ start:2181 stop:3332 length:1152 start_codon:yes stop_codon:yes gene_type:complete